MTEPLELVITASQKAVIDAHHGLVWLRVAINDEGERFVLSITDFKHNRLWPAPDDD